MNFQADRILLMILCALYLFPPLVTLIWAFQPDSLKAETGIRKMRMFLSPAVAILGNAFAFMAVHKLLIGRWNFLYTVKAVWEGTITYQDFDVFPIGLMACFGVSLVLGKLMRMVCGQGGKLPYARKTAALLLSTFLGLGILGLLSFSFSGTYYLRIYEINAIGDYIELYNEGVLPCNVYRLYLSDDSAQLQKAEIPFCTVPAKGYHVVYLDPNDLSIGRSGEETVYLSDNGGTVLDSVTTLASDVGYSSGISASGWGLVYSSPGQANVAARADLEAPVFSHTSGFYDEPFQLHITYPEGCSVYYTLDGSMPTAQSTAYSGPITVYNRSSEPNVYRSVQNVVKDWQSFTPDDTPVDKAFILRAVSVDAQGNVSKPATATYFIGLGGYARRVVVSIIADPEDLWGEDGIYVTGRAYDAWYLGEQEGNAPACNFHMHGREHEIPAYFELLSGDLTLAQNVGLRVSGGSTRDKQLKNFSIYARSVYSGSRVLDKSLFSGVTTHNLGIRGGYANSICQELVRDRSAATQRWIRAAVFLNGELWYNSNLLEKYDAQYFEQYYGVDRDNVIVINQGQVDEGDPGDMALYDELYAWLDSHDLSKAEDYAGFCQRVDLQSYIDYMCINIYIDNMDFTERKNAVWWRSRNITSNPYEDGKWRFCLYDLDAMEWSDAAMWDARTQAQKNTFSLIPRYTGGLAINQQEIYVKLMENEDFRRQFVLTFMDLVNTDFRYENVQKVLQAYGEAGEYYHSGNGGTRSLSYYEDFFQTRGAYITQYLAEEFGLEGSLQPLTISINDPLAGTVYVNTATPDLSGGSWTGQYYTDYPVTVTAEANPGYTFVGWEGGTSAATIELTLEEGGAVLYAVFEKTDP